VTSGGARKGKPWRAAAILVLALAGCGAPEAVDVVRIDRAVRHRAGDGILPPADAPGWTPITLPDFIGIGERRHAVEWWYRLAVDLPATPTTPWAVYIPRGTQTLALWVNGSVTGDGGTFTNPLPRDWNRPQFFTLAPGVLRAGANEMVVRLETNVGSPGFLQVVSVGPVAALRPEYARRVWGQITAPRIVAGMMLGGALLLFGFALRHDPQKATRWIALGVLCWTWSFVDVFVRQPPIANRLWEWAILQGQTWSVVFFAIGYHRILGIHRPRLERMLVAATLAAAIALLVIPPIYFWTAMIGVLVGVTGVAVYIARVIARASRRGEFEYGTALLIPVAVGVVFIAHDLIGTVIGRLPFGLLTVYLPLLALGGAGWIIVGRLVDSMRETDALNRDLEARVAEKHHELARNYERLRALERERAVVGERERIMRDMHDGMGGQLVSTLAMVEHGTLDRETIAEALRQSLDDLRLVIDSLDPADDDLLAVLGMVRSRLEPRLERHGISVRWQVVDVPPVPGFGPEMALQAMRIVQEALTNVVKHAGARTVTVRTGTGPDEHGRRGVFVEIIDDGGGMPASPRVGRGLANMRRRAERLGGRLVVRSSSGPGTTVWLWLPLSSELPGVSVGAARGAGG
jgi:signal transduction histidine kinase